MKSMSSNSPFYLAFLAFQSHLLGILTERRTTLRLDGDRLFGSAKEVELQITI